MTKVFRPRAKTEREKFTTVAGTIPVWIATPIANISTFAAFVEKTTATPFDRGFICQFVDP